MSDDTRAIETPRPTTVHRASRPRPRSTPGWRRNGPAARRGSRAPPPRSAPPTRSASGTGGWPTRSTRANSSSTRGSGAACASGARASSPTEGAMSLFYRFSRRTYAELIKAGREWEEETALPSRRRRVPLDDEAD